MRRVLSFDLDNCVFNYFYSTNPNRDSMHVIQINKMLFNSIIKESKKDDELILMVGSARQSAWSDRHNSENNGTESGFTALEKINKHFGQHLNARLDPFLLADVYGNVPDGTSFNNAIDPSYQGVHYDWVHDESKITILYAQIHKIALLYPNDKIVFEFYDDRGRGSWMEVDVLEHIDAYFKRYPMMLPTNVTLQLHHYEDAILNSFEPIKGTGFINQNYRQVVIDMTNLAQKITPAPSDAAFFPKSVFHVTPEQLKLPSPNSYNYIYNCFSFCFFHTSEDKTPDEKKTPLLNA